MGGFRSGAIRRAVAPVLAAVTVVAGVGTAPEIAAASSRSFQVPAFAGDFPDPSVGAFGSRYWAYSTGSAGRNLQVMNAADLRSWSGLTDPLPVLPGWAASGHTWAPSVTRVGANYVMWYTTRDAATGRQCISVATATVPQGPFTDGSSAPAICQLAHGGSIDPDVYTDSTGGRYLFWKSDDNAIGMRTHLWGEPLAADGLSVTGSPSLLMTQDAAWQSPAVEGPTVVAHGGRYYLFYGAGSYSSSTSAIGYATSPSLLGPYTDRSTGGPWLRTTGNAVGPQGPDVFTDPAGGLRLAFAAWYGTVGYPAGVRALWTAPLEFRRSGAPALG